MWATYSSHCNTGATNNHYNMWATNGRLWKYANSDNNWSPVCYPITFIAGIQKALGGGSGQCHDPHLWFHLSLVTTGKGWRRTEHSLYFLLSLFFSLTNIGCYPGLYSCQCIHSKVSRNSWQPGDQTNKLESMGKSQQVPNYAYYCLYL